MISEADESVITKNKSASSQRNRIFAEFRKYPCVEDSIRDHSLYLLGAKNGDRLRYEGMTKAKDYRSAIQIIKNGGYATDVRYVDKICDIIRRYGLDKYDAEVVTWEKSPGDVQKPVTAEVIKPMETPIAIQKTDASRCWQMPL